MQKRLKTRVLLIMIFQIAVTGFVMEAGAQGISGTVRDLKTSEPVEGITVLIKGTDKGTVTNAQGYYSIRNAGKGKYTLEVSALSYKTVETEFSTGRSDTVIDIFIESEDIMMEEVVVRTRALNNTENALVQIVKILPQVTSGISAAQISKSSDRTASEVVRRVPGVTIIDERFVVIRGLSQRYNNAWINGMAAPSTETDSRAFPLDLVPSSQIDNLIVYKSPSPEIPGDFSGGFIKITSKSIPDKNYLQASYTTGFDVKTQFNSFRIGESGPTDFLGFDLSQRPLSKKFPAHMDGVTDAAEITRLTKEGFNNNWKINSIIPLPDQRLFLAIARRMETKRMTVGNITSINYSNTFKGVQRMKNIRYDIYDYKEDRSVYLDNYFDNQFSNSARLGVLHNWSFVLNPSNRIEFKNLLNILGRNRLTERAGIRDVSSPYYREQTEIQYSSRLIYSGQFSGMHNLSSAGYLTWDAGYSHAGKSEPDRRIVKYYAGIGSEKDIPFVKTSNEDISRYFRNLHDNTLSAALNYKHDFSAVTFSPVLKTGLYGEYHSRNYTVREFVYRYSNLTSAERESYLQLPFGEMLDNRYLGADKVYIDENTQKTNNYSASVLHTAGYVALEASVKQLSIYAGIRLENRHTELSYDRSMSAATTLMTTKNFDELNLLPSVNLVYRFSEKHQLRAAYGRSLNHPELREISPSVYYDFDLFGEIGGNENLKTAKINNLDLRYEFYPAQGEMLSLGIFYKHFRNPIEWTFIDMGGQFRYTYENAEGAMSRGIEIDVRKKLDFIGLPAISLIVNATLIESNVYFRPGEMVSEPDRAMQGQSPYVINAGIYYSSQKAGLGISMLYNRIGKRIIGLGKSSVSERDINNMVPNSYEMPRNMLDLSIAKKIGKRFEIRCSLQDILAEDIVFKQFPKFMKENKMHQREQITKRYSPGQSVSFGVSVNIN
ncbi:MAG: TonB-dependent receptor [Prevotellaceae bacterium]|nr:TonB-dependent receptor [Prevotellaceae bacterium]